MLEEKVNGEKVPTCTHKHYILNLMCGYGDVDRISNFTSYAVTRFNFRKFNQFFTHYLLISIAETVIEKNVLELIGKRCLYITKKLISIRYQNAFY